MSCSKDCKKFGLAAVTAVVLFNVMEYVLHEILLKDAYSRFQGLWNTTSEMSARQPMMLIGMAVFAVLFTKIYTYGYEESKSAIGQGLRYGLLVGLMVFAFESLVQYAVYPVSLNLAWAWVAGGVVQCAILGMAVGWIYQPQHQHA